MLAVAAQRRLSVALRICDDRVCSPGQCGNPSSSSSKPRPVCSVGSLGWPVRPDLAASGVLRQLRLSSPLSYAPVSTARADRYIQTTVPIDADRSADEHDVLRRTSMRRFRRSGRGGTSARGGMGTSPTAVRPGRLS